MFPTRFESLSNDLLVEVFDYLDGYTLCSTFFGLNRRFDGLLRIAPIHIEFDANKTDQQIWDSLDSVIHPAQIRSLSFRDVDTIDDRFVNATNVNLVSLFVTSVNLSLLKSLLKKLPKRFPLKNFVCLDVVANRDDNDTTVFDLAFKKNGHRFSSMVNAVLNFSDIRSDFLSLSVNFLQLRRLDLSIDDLSCNALQFLRTNTPNLRSLKLRASPHREVRTSVSPHHLKQIVELDLNYIGNNAALSKLLILFPSLKRLHVDCRRTYRVQPTPTGSDWQAILEECVPHLRQFTLSFMDSSRLDEAVLQTFYQNEFWTARKVQARIMVDKARNLSPQVKTIYFGRQWHFSHFDQTALDISPKDDI